MYRYIYTYINAFKTSGHTYMKLVIVVTFRKE